MQKIKSPHFHIARWIQTTSFHSNFFPALREWGHRLRQLESELPVLPRGSAAKSAATLTHSATMYGTNPNNSTLTTFVISKHANVAVWVAFQLTVLPKLERLMCFVSLNMFMLLCTAGLGRIAHTNTHSLLPIKYFLLFLTCVSYFSLISFVLLF